MGCLFGTESLKSEDWPIGSHFPLLFIGSDPVGVLVPIDACSRDNDQYLSLFRLHCLAFFQSLFIVQQYSPWRCGQIIELTTQRRHGEGYHGTARKYQR
jgi:hypothetical protein